MKSIEIKNYKSFKDLTLSDLTTINLIVGKNNVGKSALLEAISIYASKGDLEQIKDILESRGEGVRFSPSVESRPEKELERFLSLYRNRDLDSFLNKPIEICATENSISSEKLSYSMKLVVYEETKEIDQEGFERSSYKVLDDAYAADQNGNIGLSITYGGRKSLYTFNGTRRRIVIEEKKPFEFVRTNLIMGDKNPELFDKVALTPNEKYILEALRIIEPQIENINFLKDEKTRGLSFREERVPFVVFSHNTQRYRLSGMGDGINRILTIILAMLSCENGILLIDEFENGLHYSVQYELWKVIFQLANQLNIQVFATTHSVDSLRGISQLISDYPKGKLLDKIACFYLQRTQDAEIKSYRYDADNLGFLISGEEEIR